MRTSSFIGLIFLIAILIVISTPTLLQSTASGLEQVGIKSALITDTQAEFNRSLNRNDQGSAATDGEQSDATLMLRGHILDQETGDLRDAIPTQLRSSNMRGRLAGGAQRALMPGQVDTRTSQNLPPVLNEGAFLRDDTNCPRFEPWDPVAMWNNPQTRSQWLTAAAEADNPAECRRILAAKAKEARGTNSLERADRRRLQTMSEYDSERMWLELMRIDLFASMTNIDAKRLENTRSSIRASSPQR